MEEKRLQPVNLESYKPLRELVFDALREAIINGTLKPRERLMEIQLAEELGVSRTPIREALRKLELEGFIVMVPRKGAYVADISFKDIADVFEIRAALEALAAGLAAERITDEELEDMERLVAEKAEAISGYDMDRLIRVDTLFHDAIYKASRNQRLTNIINNLREQIQRYRTTSLAYPGRMKRSLEEHRGIVEAIQSRDPQIAQQVAREHIENAETSIIEAIKKEGLPLSD
ncbi:MAG: GntR family transcriptional regulator [Syntrophomonadaceae bacterium]|jgi:DNA-binding GntR family transcriptional regulator|nr:GntR family transcriptional regulator [Bacillota bacterium]NLM88404.1 GntR family transcriptional regulator [Syntrophomonadaceae bacterium]HQA49351.1 GntR family transcriptional regulator [Syntrophomonadaceae bacterium]HQD89888.1 GntR family transcriptional regulator [Syntrophomonadaceae bacterium]